MPQISKNQNLSPYEIFRQKAYHLVREIPSGKVMSYGQIAAYIIKPNGIDPLAYRRIRARWVGYAMASCPGDVPWQRVVNKQGKISHRFGHGPDLQHHLLEEEGVSINPLGEINLSKLAWQPDPFWLASHGFNDAASSEP
jgi:methylated-DNA-protein-cysteine methyltransferase related protein